MATIGVDTQHQQRGRLWRSLWLAVTVLALGAGGVLVSGASSSDTAMAEAAVRLEIPSMKAWALAAPQEYRRLIADEAAAHRAGVPEATRREARERDVHATVSAKLARADDAMVLQQLRLTLEVGDALAERAPELCVQMYEQGVAGPVERALPSQLRRAWVRHQASVMRVPYGARPSLAQPDEEVIAFTRASEAAARRLGLTTDEFMARMVGRADPAAVCAAHNALTASLIEADAPAVVARIYRRQASQVSQR